ncbi:serine/threonine-protein kinase RIO3-like [Episyrphus balteatus]|uniref:serine/threonine-protein kinase RIO3-like n=1 Tax=Episyrphus balteatus TaxID=286459 RepID=UPI002485AD5A|nr:serine/threonine-protein kinase RIO3-like [Episyrphus balteatus]
MSSPWGKVENIQSINFAEIMSQERQNKEIKTNELDRLNDLTKINKKETQPWEDQDFVFLDNYIVDDDEDYYQVDEEQNLDRFETNEKLDETLPKRGFKIPKQNFIQVRSYPCKKIKAIEKKDIEENRVRFKMGFDQPTRLLLYKLIQNEIVKQITGIVSTGKGAVILHGTRYQRKSKKLLFPNAKEYAIKIYKTTLSEEPKNPLNKLNNRPILDLWAEKEMHNLKRMQEAGINSPSVVTVKKHILVMSFIGLNHKAAPKLRHANLDDDDLSDAYDQIVEMMHKLYNVAKLVHADLSAYNILWHDYKCWFIDVAQSVKVDHPNALKLLLRDCGKVVSFFKQRGLPNVDTKEKLFEQITSLNAATFERIDPPSIQEDTAPNLKEVPGEPKPQSNVESKAESSIEDELKLLRIQ